MRIGTDIIAYGLHPEIDFVSEQKPSKYVIMESYKGDISVHLCRTALKRLSV